MGGSRLLADRMFHTAVELKAGRAQRDSPSSSSRTATVWSGRPYARRVRPGDIRNAAIRPADTGPPGSAAPAPRSKCRWRRAPGRASPRRGRGHPAPDAPPRRPRPAARAGAPLRSHDPELGDREDATAGVGLAEPAPAREHQPGRLRRRPGQGSARRPGGAPRPGGSRWAGRPPADSRPPPAPGPPRGRRRRSRLDYTAGRASSTAPSVNEPRRASDRAASVRLLDARGPPERRDWPC